MKVTLTLSANAGVAISLENLCVWVDALHNHKVNGFSSVSEEQFLKMLNGSDFPVPNAICYTHCHPDHYSGKMTAVAMERFPEAKVFLPEKKLEKQILIDGDACSYAVGNITLEFHRLVHEGTQYQEVNHYGIVITAEDKHILIAGDCAVANDALKEMAGERCVDLTVLTFPWLTLKKGRAFLEEKLMPRNIVAYHIPFEGDDVFGYRAAALKAANAFEGVQLLHWPMEKIEIEI